MACPLYLYELFPGPGSIEQFLAHEKRNDAIISTMNNQKRCFYLLDYSY